MSTSACAAARCFNVIRIGSGYFPVFAMCLRRRCSGFAREALQAEGWTVLQGWDEGDRSVDAHRWVAERVEAALTTLQPTCESL
jgi:hypothetical protein